MCLPAIRRMLRVSFFMDLIEGISQLEYQTTSSQNYPTTIILLNDCEHLILEFFHVISTTSSHVYKSALLFIPQ